MILRLLVSLILLSVSALCSWAYDFSAPNADGNIIYYNKIAPGCVEVTSAQRYGATPDYYGSLAIPSSVLADGESFAVTAISPRAFAWCSDLETLSLPASVTAIGANAFDGCFALESIMVAGGNLSDDAQCVVYDLSAKSLLACAPATEGVYEVNDGTLAIEQSAFAACPFLEGVNLPDGLRSIGDNAFYFCNYLTGITIPASVESIGRAALADCLSLEAITVDSDSEHYRSIDGMLYDAAASTLIQCPGAKAALADVPDGVRSIGDEAFFRNYGITTVKLPASLTHIGEGAFIDCQALASVEIPASVESIGTLAFALCPRLSSVYMAAKDPAEVALGEGVFTDIDMDACTLYVPEGSESAYINSPQWSEFKHVRGYEALRYQTLSWEESADSLLVGSTVQLSAQASSGLPVSYALSPASQALAAITDDALTVFCPGEVVVYAYQPGDVEYAPATPVARTFVSSFSGIADEEYAEAVRVYGIRGAVVIADAPYDAEAAVFDLAGHLLYRGFERVVPLSTPGVYIVRIAGRGYKTMVR